MLKTQTKSSTQLQCKVVPFVAVEMSFSLHNELRLQIILAGEKTFSHQVTVTSADQERTVAVWIPFLVIGNSVAHMVLRMWH